MFGGTGTSEPPTGSGGIARTGVDGLPESPVRRSGLTAPLGTAGPEFMASSVPAGACLGTGGVQPLVEGGLPSVDGGAQLVDLSGGDGWGSGAGAGPTPVAARSPGTDATTGSAAMACPSASTVNHATCPPLV